ncbi:MAG: hypothetical protein ACQRW7_01035 [Caulobacterales bacterium]|uniref:hypothetical protein n=1 Tax=Glycocaulis sp. TaxID=1969725 RepID=UPI003FA0F0BB
MVDFDLNDPEAVEHALRNRAWRERGVLTDAEAVGMSAASKGEFVPMGLLTGDATVGVLRILQEYRVIKALNARIRPRGWRRLWTLEHIVRAHVIITVSEGFAISKATAAELVATVYDLRCENDHMEPPSSALAIVGRTCDAIRSGAMLELDRPEVIYLADRRQLYVKTWVPDHEVLDRAGTVLNFGSTDPVVERERQPKGGSSRVDPIELEYAISLTSVKLHQALHNLTARAMEVGR